MARKHRPYGKGVLPEEYGRDKSVRAKARKHRIRQAVKNALKEADARDSLIIHCDHVESVNAFKL